MSRRIVAIGLALLGATSIGCKVENEGDQHPSAPRVPDVRPVAPTIKATPAQTAAVPVPGADPFLQDRARFDPYLALMQLVWYGKRNFDMQYTVSAGGKAHSKACVAKKGGDGICSLVMSVKPGDVIGFTAFPDAASPNGFAQCSIIHQGKTLDFAHVQAGPCAVSATIPAAK